MDSMLARESEAFLKDKVSPAMENYELRQPQIDMMSACSKTIETGGTLLAEAGTGTGKTFAYLIPAMLSGKKALVSTRTINLQEQLASKDLKFLSTLFEFDYAIAKGRGNYLCLRRLNAFRSDNDDEEIEIRNLLNWAMSTDAGDMEDYVFRRSSIWDRVCSDADACRGRKCGHYGKCWYFRARQKWEKADVVVANHALTVINAVLGHDSKILPQAEILVVDEGHALDNVITDHAGITLSDRGVENIIGRLLKVDGRGMYKGLLSKSPHLFPAVGSLKSEMELLWIAARREFRDRETIKAPFRLATLMKSLSASASSLVDQIKTTAFGLFKEDEEIELKAAMLKLAAFADSMSIFAEGLEGHVRWAEIEERRTAFRMSPVYPRDFVRHNLLPEHEAVVITSATLSVSGDFSFMSNVLGLEESEKMAVPSPFDFREQTSIEIVRGINLRNDNTGVEKLAGAIVREASKKDGGMLVLFTSRDVMNRAWDLSIESLSDMGLNPMVQGEIPNRTMLEIMRESSNTVIFGLDSFWEGVDVQGDSLKSLVITKLPFEVPTEPIPKARTAEIEKKGGNPFYEYSLPRAIIKFRQGFGRLIRSRQDRGRVIICDERVETMRYGRRFIESVM